MKTFTLFVLVAALIGMQSINAEGKPADSVNVVRTAKRNARAFKPDKDIVKKVKEDKLKSSSDYFKPSIDYTSNTKLLGDSVYVRAFREAAFYRALNKRGHSARKGFIIAGGITIGVVVALVLLAEVFKNYN